MKIEYKNGATCYSDFEIQKALTSLERGISIETFFKHEAKRFEFGENEYFNTLIREVEIESQMYDHRQWEYYEIAFGVGLKEVEKVINDLQKLNIQPPAKQSKTNLKNEYRFNTDLAESVPDLFDELSKRKMITGNKDHFIWAFGIGKDKPTDFKQLVWNGENTLLAYLINKVCTNRKKWEVAKMIFGVSGLAQTFTNCKGNPRGKEFIDEIIHEIG